MRKRFALMAAFTAAGCLGDDIQPDPEPAPDTRPAGDYLDGTLLRLRVVSADDVGSLDCGIRDSWTWRYYANYVLIPDGPNPRLGPYLDFYASDHGFDAQYPTVAPVGSRTERVRLFQGGSFTYTVWFGGQSEYDEGCATFLNGVVEEVKEP